MDWVLISLIVAGLVTGFSKFSVGGMGILILPLVMLAVPGPEALGVVLPLYLLTDLIAIVTYRKQISWPVLFRILPLGFLGVAVAGWWLSAINPTHFAIILGVSIVLVLAMSVYLDIRESRFMQNPMVLHITGFATGFISMIANAAGPLMSLILIEQKLPKTAYISTRAWAFFLLNLAKLIPLLSLGLINQETLAVTLQTLPGLAVGMVIGFYFLRSVNVTQFKWMVRAMALISAVNLVAMSIK
ncbi:MAG: sulfite exporter TauE/SafE family protein [Pontibacterium sp.]